MKTRWKCLFCLFFPVIFYNICDINQKHNLIGVISEIVAQISLHIRGNNHSTYFLYQGYFPLGISTSGGRCSLSPHRRLTSNDISCHYFCDYSPPPLFSFFLSAIYFSHRRSAQIKKTFKWMLTGAPKNLGGDPFPDLVGHFGCLRFSRIIKSISYLAEVDPSVWTLSRPHWPFWGTLVAILDLAGGASLQVV